MQSSALAHPPLRTLLRHLPTAPPPRTIKRPVAAIPGRLDCDPPVATLRFVTIKLAATVSGHTEKAIRRKIERGVWLEGKHWRRKDGVIYIDTKEIDKWVETATA